MIDNCTKTAFNICACICAQDGIISSQEEASLIANFKLQFQINDDDVEALFDDFFESTLHIDSYLKKVTDTDLRKKITAIAQSSAAADGLAIKENIALERIKMIWGLS